MDDDIREDVLLFIADQIDSVPHLEALLLLWESRARPWTEDEIATRVYVDAQTAHHLLHGLARRGLIVAEEGSPRRYVYDPRGNAYADLLPAVAATYRRHLIRIAKLIHSKASPGVREFARAFQLKKD